jgi:hypothetical protein
MNIQRLRKIEKLGVSPEEMLEYALIRNNSIAISEALQEHGLQQAEAEEFDPEEALTFAIFMLPENLLTTLLRPHGYQPIPTRKQAKREKALSH